MFHFIVKGAGWTPDRDTIDRGRTLEYTEEHIKDLYASGGNLDLEKTTKIPALFARSTPFELIRVTVRGETGKVRKMRKLVVKDFG